MPNTGPSPPSTPVIVPAPRQSNAPSGESAITRPISAWNANGAGGSAVRSRNTGTIDASTAALVSTKGASPSGSSRLRLRVPASDATSTTAR